MAIATDGIIYVADSENHVVRAVDLVADRVTIVAGIPTSPGRGGDGGQGRSAQLNYPLDVEFGPDGRLYIADEDNHAVRSLDLTSGVLRTVAGKLGQTSSDDCLFPPSALIGDGKPATEALLRNPRGLAFDGAGRLYIVDTFHYRIRVMTLEANS
jgi:sugar lactone lactonase YvrE